MLPFFFRHYDEIVDRYFITDNQSTDRSLEILKNHPKVTLSQFELKGKSVCSSAIKKANSNWKSSRGDADWVVVCNIDELFDHENLMGYLIQAKARGITYIPSLGQQMVTESFPEKEKDLVQSYRKGLPDVNFNKPSFFDPNQIKESGFTVGRHTAFPKGNVVFCENPAIKLMHYKYLGLDYVIQRHRDLQKKMRKKDKKEGWGCHYNDAGTEKNYRDLTLSAVDIKRSKLTESLPVPTKLKPEYWRKKSLSERIKAKLQFFYKKANWLLETLRFFVGFPS